jgi:hypothetical protein
MKDRKHHGHVRGAAPGLGAIAARIDGADPDELVALIARANAALPDSDSRKIRPSEVALLRHLADKAQIVDSSIVGPATPRQSAGAPDRPASPEAGKTARWTARLLVALEAIVSSPRALAEQPGLPPRSAVQGRAARGREHESLAHQTRDFRASDDSVWRVRIEQGGGVAAPQSGDPPVAALIFCAANAPGTVELSVAEPGGKWDLAAYTDAELQEVLDRALDSQQGPFSGSGPRDSRSPSSSH